MYTVGIITVSDTCSRKEKTDLSGPALKDLFTKHQYDVRYYNIVSDDKQEIIGELKKCVDELKLNLVITTGGTGFAQRDNTPEATLEVCDKIAPGIAEYMRLESSKITKKAFLSRGACGIRNQSIIVNLPGSSKAATENAEALLEIIDHALNIASGAGSAQCGETKAKILATCISEKKGIKKKEVPQIEMKIDHGIVGDAHAGNWHRQISLLSNTSVDKLRSKLTIELKPGAFAENILIDEGICLYKLPIGTKLKIGTAETEVTQIGKECHFDCEIRKKAGDCVMPREGIFVKVLKEGIAKPGDYVEIIR